MAGQRTAAGPVAPAGSTGGGWRLAMDRARRWVARWAAGNLAVFRKRVVCHLLNRPACLFCGGFVSGVATFVIVALIGRAW